MNPSSRRGSAGQAAAPSSKASSRCWSASACRIKRTAPPCGTASIMLSRIVQQARLQGARRLVPRGRSDKAQAAGVRPDVRGCATGQEPALVQHEHLRTALGFVQIGSGDDHRQALISDHLQDDVPQFHAGKRVHAHGRLIAAAASRERAPECRQGPASASFRPTVFQLARVKRAKVGHVQQAPRSAPCEPSCGTPCRSAYRSRFSCTLRSS